MHETVEEAKNLSLPHFLYKLIFSDITYLMYTFLKLTTFEKIFFKTRLCVRSVLEMILYIYFTDIPLFVPVLLCFFWFYDFWSDSLLIHPCFGALTLSSIGEGRSCHSIRTYRIFTVMFPYSLPYLHFSRFT